MTKTDRKDLPKLNAAERPAVDPPTTMTSKRCLLFPCVDVKEGEESDTTPDTFIRNGRTSSCCKLCLRNFITFAQQQEAFVLDEEGAKEKPSQRLLHKTRPPSSGHSEIIPSTKVRFSFLCPARIFGRTND
jgi:hypothetical protein